MQNLFSPETFEFFARYLLAGFVIISTRSWYVVGEKPKPADVFFEAVILSLVNQMVFLALQAGMLWLFAATEPVLPGRLWFFVEVLMLPALLGFLSAANLIRGWKTAFLPRLFMPLERPARTAYDYVFSRQSDPCMVILTYEDATVVHGYFGPNSIAASDPSHGDLYLERLYFVDERGQWIEADPPRGALLSLTSLRSLEFLTDEGENDDQN